MSLWYMVEVAYHLFQQNKMKVIVFFTFSAHMQYMCRGKGTVNLQLYTYSINTSVSLYI